MIRIDRVRVVLPPALQADARDFAEQLGRALTDVPFSKDARLSAMRIQLTMKPGAAVAELARQAATKLHSHVEGIGV